MRRLLRSPNPLLGILVLPLILTACGMGGGSGGVSPSPSTTSKPSAPTVLSVTAGSSQVTVGWSEVSGATSYTVHMASQSGVTTSNDASLPDGMKHDGVTSPFTHTGLTNGKTYYFVVTAVNAQGESPISQEASAAPAPPKAIALAAGGFHACAVV